jgi:NADPH:quinone reductase-like Zn-dependent oxidoreductase
MRSAIVHQAGTLPEPGETDAPQPEQGQAVVAVSAAALNPVEIRVAAGTMGPLDTPYVPGLEGVGTVVSSARIAQGTRVRFESHLPGFGKNGALAEQVAVDEETLIPLPDALPSEDAAAAGVVGITAVLALERAGMVAVGRDQTTLAELADMGATEIVSLTEVSPDDLTEVIAGGGGGAVDVVVDTLWGAPAMSALAALAVEGRLVNVGNLAGVDVTLPLGAMRRARSAVIGLSSGWAPIEDKVAAYQRLVDAMASGEVRVKNEVIRLEDVAEAWRRQASSPHRKLVITPA